MSYPFPRYSSCYLQDPISNYTLQSAMFGGPLIFQQELMEWDAEMIQLTSSFIQLVCIFIELISK